MAGFDDLMPAEKSAGQPAMSGFDDLATANPSTVGMGERVLRGMLDPIEGGAQMLYNALPPGVVQAGNRVNNALAKYGLVAPIGQEGLNADIRGREAEYQARRGDDRASVDWARIGGNVISPMNLALGATAAPASIAGAVGTAGGLGAASSLLNPSYAQDSDIAFDKLKQAAVGGVSGATIGGLGAIGSRMLSPNASRNPNVRLLLNENVEPTIGQTLGGAANRWEEKLQSTPIAGDFITGARQNARNTFNQAQYNRVTGPLGVRPTGLMGHEAVAELQDATGDAYGEAATRLGSFRLDRQGIGQFRNLEQMVTNLPDDQQRLWRGTMQEIRTDISPRGFIQGEGFKNIDSTLGAASREYRASPNPSDRRLGNAFGEMRDTIRQNMGRQAGPEVRQLYNNADTAYANLVRVEGAAGRAGASEGVNTPGQLLAAVKSADQTARKRGFAAGHGLMQDLGSAGQSVIGNKVPDSGTAGRLMTPAAIAAALINPKVLATTVAAPILYSRPAQSALVALAARRPELAHRLAPLLLQGSTAAAPGAAQLTGGLLNY
jgi:hypothetical protein